MEKLSFKTLQAVYLLNMEYRKLKGEDYVSEYSCQWHLKAQYDPASKTYIFNLDRKDVKINRKKVQKLMDKIMLEIGNSLYPIRFEVTPQLQITQIINYDEIVDRWRETTQKCRNEHPDNVMERYIRYSVESFSSHKSLLLSLYRDSFINLYFRNLYELPRSRDERERVEWFNFPLREMKSSYFCAIEESDENKRKLEGPLMAISSGQKGLARIDFTYGTYGEPEEIDGLFTTTNDLKEYRKIVKISREKNQRMKLEATGS